MFERLVLGYNELCLHSDDLNDYLLHISDYQWLSVNINVYQ